MKKLELETSVKPPEYVIRVQVQGKKLTQQRHIPLGPKPVSITASETIIALRSMKSELSKNDLQLTNTAFDKAEKWVNQVAQNGGIGPIGSKSFTNKGVNPNDARVDVEILRGHNLTPP
jgi:hypothetical protein